MAHSLHSNARGELAPTGRIDIHSHLLPAVDDGCMDFEESLECVRRLKAAGFIGSICTPHVYPQDSSCHQIEHIRRQVAALDQQLRVAGVDYHLWPGGELRIYDGVIDWLKDHAVPTLAGSRCVLVDFWASRWPKWVTRVFEWLLKQGYRPILAHPERIACADVLDRQLKEMTEMGVWLQGNFRCMTGEDGYDPDLWVRRLLGEGRYHFLALDMHRPNALDGRFDGMQLVIEEFGRATLDRLTVDHPRRLILSCQS